MCTVICNHRLLLPLYVAGSLVLGVIAPSAIIPAHAQTGCPVPESPRRASPVRTIDTAQWSPPSPDPGGIAYDPRSQQLLVSDAEVNEIPSLFTGDNVYQATTAGSLVDTFSTIPFSGEPTGVAVNPNNGHLFFPMIIKTRSLQSAQDLMGNLGRQTILSPR